MNEQSVVVPKVIYSAPLKALSSEKFHDWTQGVFKNEKILQLTGDTLTSAKIRTQMMEECKTASIILMTSELLDSLTRNHQSENYQWLMDVVLMICDESHIITSEGGRGACVEASIMRFTQINPRAKIWCLSATLQNVDEFSTWLTVLNKKPTQVLNSDWRPTTLVWHFVKHIAFGGYFDIQADKIRQAVKLVLSKPDEKYMVVVWDKNTGRFLLSALREAGVVCEFHNADVDFDGRTEIVSRFEQDQDPLRVIVCTPTLIWGCNTSAQNVVIVGTTRGLAEVSELDMIQAGGRAGRFGKAPEGHVYLICDNEAVWEQQIKNPRPVTSTLLDLDALAFHICAEIKNKVIYNEESLYGWYGRTLASIQGPLTKELIQNVLAKLEDWQCVKVENGLFRCTSLGMVSATLYYHPKDVYHWATCFSYIERNNLWEDDVALAYALAMPSGQLPYIAKSEQMRVDKLTYALRKVWSEYIRPSTLFADIYDLLVGEKPSMQARQFKQDAERVCGALSWIGGIKAIARADMWTILPLRLKYGVSAKVVNLCRLPGIGAARAEKLWALGVKTLEDVINNPAKVKQAVGDKLLSSVVIAARKLVRMDQTGE